jgi:hypothetical protein
VGKVWVLDTETKGTGANMVPLESVQQRPSPQPAPIFVPPKPREPAPEAPAPKAPPEFKVLDVMTREVLLEGAGARETLDLLKTIRSVVDVRLFRREAGAEEWRPLSLGEQRAIWDLRDRQRTR